MGAKINVLICLLLFGNGLIGQSGIENTVTFQEFIEYLDQHTDYRYSYPDELNNRTLVLGGDINFSAPHEFESFLLPAGIELKVRKNLLIFKKQKNSEPVPASLQKRVLSGYVRDEESGESLIGAHVIDVNSGAGVSTNVYGFFSLVVTGDYIEASYIGFEKVKIKLQPDQSELTINLQPHSNMLSEVVITGEQKITEVTAMSIMKLAPEKIKKLPVFMGESDVLKSLQLLPGVQSGNEGSSGIYVRGGGQDQNLILLDGVPVYNANHLFGFFSVFNTDAIKNVSLIKGGFPARYGGRLSSVVDIQMKEGNMNKLEGEGALGIIASKLTLSGPINQGKTSFMVSGRRTYIDALTVPLMKLGGANPVFGYNFWDLNAKINHIASKKDRFYLSFYSGRDRFFNEHKFKRLPDVDEEEHQTLNWGNITSAFRWNRQFNKKLFANLTTTYSRYQFKLATTLDYQYSEGFGSPDIYRESAYFSNIQDIGMKVDFDYFLDNHHHIKFGANAISHQLKPGVSSYKSHTEVDTTFGSRQINLEEYYVYLEDEIKLMRSLSMNLGIHVSGAAVANSFYQSVQPRVSLNQKLSNQWSFKASYARMAQYIHLLVNSGIGLPTDLWVPSTDIVKPQLSDQVAAGVVANLGGIELSVESYYKWMDNLIEYKDGAGFLDIDSDWEHKVAFGTGKSYGIECFVQKKIGQSTGWVGYTWSKTNRHFDQLNFGKAFPYRYDRRHDVSLVYSYQISEQISLGAVWVYGTGNAITLPTSSYPKATWDTNEINYNEFIKHYPGRNSSRMEDYHRLDLNVSFKKQKRWGERTLVFGLFNAYNRQNPTYIDFDDRDPQNKQFKKFSLFPIMPNVSYQFKF